MKYMTLILFTLFPLLFVGCGGISMNPGFGTNVPGNVTGTRGMMEHEKIFNEDGTLLREYRVARVEMQGDNIIKGFNVDGDMGEGTVNISADDWISSKEKIVIASGEREAGNTTAAGDAAANAANPIGSAIAEIIEAGSGGSSE